MEKVNKAQEKRDRTNTQFIDADLRRKLADFENNYLNSTVAFELKQLDLQIKGLEKEIVDFPNREITRANRGQTVANLEQRLARVKRVRQLDATIILNTINEAKRTYDLKVDGLVKTLVQEGFGYGNYKVESIKARGGELEFLISKSDKEVHARFIFVNGEIKAPHFRFITTVRAIK